MVFLLGTLLRLYKLDGFVTFLGDQGRDAIIMKRIITFEHLPAVGAPSSVGQVYLGPFYYYFMAPWLAFFNFNPIGPAVGVALLSSLFIMLVFYGVTDLYGPRAGLIASTLVAFSSVLIDLSRFSWNPNILPIFSFIAFYFFIKALLMTSSRTRTTRQRLFYILAGIFLGCAFQLHYVTFSLLFAYGAVFTFFLWNNPSKSLLSKSTQALFMVGSFLIINTPLVFFDLRHQFLNTKNFITLFQKPGTTGSTSLMSIIDGFSSLNTFAFSLNIPALVVILMLIVLLFTLRIWKDKEYQYLLIVFVSALFVTSFMTAHKFPHYFGALYPLYYVVIAVIISRLVRNESFMMLCASIMLGGFIYIQSLHYPFLHARPNNQIEHASQTAKRIHLLVTKEKFRITGIPDTLGTSMYAYFLEINGKTPVNSLSLDPVDELFVVCEQQCKPIGNPQWDIAYFKPRRVKISFRSGNVYIYKLIQ